MGAFNFGELVEHELAGELPGVDLSELRASFGASPDAGRLAYALVDGAVRELGALGLLAAGHPEAAQSLRDLEPAKDAASAKAVMMAVEKVGWKHKAPNVFLRALGGAASTLLVLERAGAADEERTQAALFQVAAAVARVVGMARRQGAPPAELVRALRAPGLRQP